MEPALKQRLIGAAVLVALAVIFLPMLIKGPAPESGVSDVSLDVPAQPGDDGMETRELPLLAPARHPRARRPGPAAAARAFPCRRRSAGPERPATRPTLRFPAPGP